MITVIYDSKHLALSVEGHSGYAPMGQDIICSSVSILTMTLATFAERMEGEGILIEKATIELDNGSSYISIKPKTICYTRCKTVFDAICEGYKLLAENEPNYVQYISREDLI